MRRNAKVKKKTRSINITSYRTKSRWGGGDDCIAQVYAELRRLWEHDTAIQWWRYPVEKWLSDFEDNSTLFGRPLPNRPVQLGKVQCGVGPYDASIETRQTMWCLHVRSRGEKRVLLRLWFGWPSKAFCPRLKIARSPPLPSVAVEDRTTRLIEMSHSVISSYIVQANLEIGKVTAVLDTGSPVSLLSEMCIPTNVCLERRRFLIPGN